MNGYGHQPTGTFHGYWLGGAMLHNILTQIRPELLSWAAATTELFFCNHLPNKLRGVHHSFAFCCPTFPLSPQRSLAVLARHGVGIAASLESTVGSLPGGPPSRSGPEVKTRPSSLGLTLGGFAGGESLTWGRHGQKPAARVPIIHWLLEASPYLHLRDLGMLRGIGNICFSVFSWLSLLPAQAAASCAKSSVFVKWSRRKRRGRFL